MGWDSLTVRPQERSLKPVHRHLTLRSPLPVDAETACAWHERAGAIERLSPPWERRSFRGVQITGPFDIFDRTHRFVPAKDGTSTMEDAIGFAVPGGVFGDALGRRAATKRIERTFAYRHRVLAHDLSVHRDAPKRGLRILVSGASGLIGRNLVHFLTTGGHSVCRLTRGVATRADEIQFDPIKGAASPSQLQGFDAVIHLAGEPIAEARWNAERKARIRDSRVVFTRRLAETLAALDKRPAVLISGSAMGYYGDRGDRVLRESDAPGEGFLSATCVEWERATEPAEQAGIRVAHLRTSLVLTPEGGGLAPMLLPWALGLGGRLGSGSQYWSFIAIDDLLYLIHHILMTDSIRGAVNASSPQAVTNAEFAATLSRVLRRPAILLVSRGVLRLVVGEMADPLLLASARLNPEKAMDHGFRFAYPGLEQALRHVLGRSAV